MDTNSIIERRSAITNRLGQVRYALDKATKLVDHLESELNTNEQELVDVNAELQKSLVR